jgi:hypothetical protein
VKCSDERERKNNEKKMKTKKNHHRPNLVKFDSNIRPQEQLFDHRRGRFTRCGHPRGLCVDRHAPGVGRTEVSLHWETQQLRWGSLGQVGKFSVEAIHSPK